MRPANTDLSQQFAKFAGREVKVEEKHFPKWGITEARVDHTDPAVAELTAAVQATGLQLRLWSPGMMGTMDYRLNRLNAHVEKAADGKYRIGSSFTLG